ncbi:hypothetical protein FQN50_003179 [Emmonsiellopsis sp. PD_5]|nr:hypothetical protein FQN50_003179 [Emmonsiellopsis sp. PD_5]
MKGIICEKVGDPWKIVDNLDVPEPSPDQILVKSLYMAINPADGLMQSTGALVQGWPLGLGLDVAGVVVKVGENATSLFKVGDYEFLLMDAKVTIPKPESISLVEASTIGVGILTAALGLFHCLDVELPNAQEILSETYGVPVRDEWAVVLGGASCVGKFAIKLFDLLGYKVIASCSVDSVPLVKKQYADAVFDYNTSIDEQVKDVLAFTKGNVHRVFDAAATGDAFAKELFKQLPEGPKLFSSTNSWSGITDFEGGKTKIVELAPIGRPEAEELNKLLAEYIPVLVAAIDHKRFGPGPYDLIGQGGFEDALEALSYQQKGAGRGNKVVVKIQDE